MGSGVRARPGRRRPRRRHPPSRDQRPPIERATFNRTRGAGGSQSKKKGAEWAPFPSDYFPSLRRLSESLAQDPQLLDLRRCELMVALRQISHRVVEPILLVLRLRADNTAAHHLLKKLVPSLLKWCGRADWLFPESVFRGVHQFR